MRKLVIGPLVSLASFAVSLGCIEGALRVWARLEGRRQAEQLVSVDPQNRPIVVFCGDSNIYGVYVEASETLPAAVQRLSTKGNVKGIRAVNLAIPGQASWHTLEQVRKGLTVKPAAIVVTCGINNLSIRPTDEGLGVLEELRIVKTIRRQWANYAVAGMAVRRSKLELGPGGKPIEGNHVLLGDGKGVVVMTDREGTERFQTSIGSLDPGNFQSAAPRMREDFAAMIRECQAAGVPLVFATYLAGDEGHFDGITALMRELCQAHDVAIADCARQLEPALWQGLDKGTPVRIQIHSRQNNRARILTYDGHPTPLGYEVEARVVARALKSAGILPAYEDEDPLAPLLTASVTTPYVRQSDENFQEFVVKSAPGDRVVLLVGSVGFSIWNGTPVPLDTEIAERVRDKYGLKESEGIADAEGQVKLAIVGQFLKDMPRPVSLVALAERGGSQGSARRFLTSPLTVNVPP